MILKRTSYKREAERGPLAGFGTAVPKFTNREATLTVGFLMA